jgi:hypothetical protein
MADDLKMVFEQTPVKDWELHSYIIADLYKNKMAFFTVYPYSSKGVKLNLSMVQAIAINEFFAAHSEHYNIFLRLKIEPQLKLSYKK